MGGHVGHRNTRIIAIKIYQVYYLMLPNQMWIFDNANLDNNDWAKYKQSKQANQNLLYIRQKINSHHCCNVFLLILLISIEWFKILFMWTHASYSITLQVMIINKLKFSKLVHADKRQFIVGRNKICLMWCFVQLQIHLMNLNKWADLKTNINKNCTIWYKNVSTIQGRK